MSLTVSLQTTAGASSAVVTNGQVLTLDVVATVAGVDGTATYDGLQDVEGSFLSTAVGTSAVAGNLVVTGAVAPFDALGSAPGTAQDLNGDGNIDVGSDVLTSSAVGDYFFARAGNLDTGGVVSGANMSFTIATVTYTVTATNDGGPTDIAFRPRDTSQVPGTVAAVWTESSAGTSDQDTGTFQAGAPFQVTAAPSTGTVTATVYGDTNGDGVRGGAETGLAGATVYVDVAGTGTYVTSDPSALTDSAGDATVTGVPAGGYTLREVPPAGYTQSVPGAGAGHAVSVTAGVTVDAGTFGVEPDGSVSGSVYVDGNGNGTEDTGDSASAGTAVYLDVNGDGSDDAGDVSTTTTEDGTFTLAEVPPGTYALRAVATSGLAVSQPGGGSYSVRVTPGGALIGQVFGIATAGSISGTVYVDVNQDGVDDAEDAVAPVGTEVYLDVEHGGAQVSGDPTAATDSTGAFHFADVAPGTYVLYPVVPAGYVLTQPTAGAYTVTVTAGGTASGYAIGIVPFGTVTGTVYDDVNGNGTQDVGEVGLAGVTVYVDVNYNGLDSLDITGTTDATGHYMITGVPGGTHTLRDVVPAGDTQTAPASGSYTISAVNAQTTAGGAFGIDVPVATTGAITGTAPAGATIYLDANGNGRLDAGEAGATTNADGMYAFADVAPGTYLVRALVPLGDAVTTPRRRGLRPYGGARGNRRGQRLHRRPPAGVDADGDGRLKASGRCDRRGDGYAEGARDRRECGTLRRVRRVRHLRVHHRGRVHAGRADRHGDEGAEAEGWQVGRRVGAVRLSDHDGDGDVPPGGGRLKRIHGGPRAGGGDGHGGRDGGVGRPVADDRGGRRRRGGEAGEGGVRQRAHRQRRERDGRGHGGDHAVCDDDGNRRRDGRRGRLDPREKGGGGREEDGHAEGDVHRAGGGVVPAGRRPERDD